MRQIRLKTILNIDLNEDDLSQKFHEIHDQ